MYDYILLTEVKNNQSDQQYEDCFKLLSKYSKINPFLGSCILITYLD